MVGMGTAPNLRSISPASYAQLPSLAHPAAYILVIRDIDSDRYRIQATENPKSYIDATLAEQERDFGIELLSILETDDIAVSELRLFERHHAALSAEWLALDEYQLRELQKSDLQVYAYHSLYIRSGQSSRVKSDAATGGVEPERETGASGRSRAGPRASQQKPVPEPPLTWNRYGANALRRNRARDSITTERKPSSLKRRIDIALTDLWVKHPGKCMAALALLALWLLTTVDLSCSPRGGCP